MMKTKFRIALASVLVAGSLAVTAGAANFENCADKLHDLGLFQGTTTGYQLDRAPTRGEAATMLVRLLGKEAEAKQLTYTAPFTDLANWQKPYVQYLYENGLTKGTSADKFTPDSQCSAQMYTTFLLRALDYSDAKGGDFTYAGALDFAESKDVIDAVSCNADNFLRDNVAAMSYGALYCGVNGEDYRLIDKLIDEGAVDKTKGAAAQEFFDNYYDYAAASLDAASTGKTDMDMTMSGSVTYQGASAATFSMKLNAKTDIDYAKPDQLKMAMTGKLNATVSKALTGEDADTKLDQDISYYFANGYAYTKLGDVKIKMPVSIDEAISSMGGANAMMQVSPLCMIKSITKSGDTMTVTYDADSFGSLFDQIFDTAGVDLDGLGMKFDKLDMSATLKNGKLTGSKVAMNMSIDAADVHLGVAVNADAVVNATGSGVKVELPADLDTYKEIVGGADKALQ